MITLKLSEKQLDDLYEEMSSNDNLRVRKKCLIVYTLSGQVFGFFGKQLEAHGH